jgi:hypothetical protein
MNIGARLAEWDGASGEIDPSSGAGETEELADPERADLSE